MLLGALALQGCLGSLLDSDAPGPDTCRLGGGVAVPEAAGTATTALGLTVARPLAAVALDTDRIAIVPAASRFDYYNGVRWAAPAPQMLQESLVTALQASGRFAGVFAAPSGVPAELTLDVELRHFEAVAVGDAAPAVVIQVQASLVDARRAQRLASFVSEARVQSGANRREAIIDAFERANRAVVADVVARIGEAAIVAERAPVAR
ncbi:MAG: ABC-type transport auxiliary lipoprotein family protein [Steroidobacteraceae bacterium]